MTDLVLDNASLIKFIQAQLIKEFPFTNNVISVYNSGP